MPTRSSIVEGEGIYFLKHLYHARKIRNNIIDSFEMAAVPGTSAEERERLLSFVVVGGGPTSCEFVAELYDFVTTDIVKLYPDLVQHIKVSLVEAGPALLGPFDAKLQEYTKRLFETRDIDVRLATSVGAVEDYEGDGFRFPAKKALLSDGSELPFGTLVWSAGLKAVHFTEDLDLPKGQNGRILVDDYLRVKGYEGSIWAMGDSAMNEHEPLPQLAQVARQQGMYLADIFNKKQTEDEKSFKYFSLGSMASVGKFKGLYDGKNIGVKGEEIDVPGMTGFVALLVWRFAYWGRQTSIENKILIPMYWLKSFFFGRDTSRF
jgi:NADH dehydrogenase/NADH:ubiquinone reductase (non-electrogenic)